MKNHPFFFFYTTENKACLTSLIVSKLRIKQCAFPPLFTCSLSFYQLMSANEPNTYFSLFTRMNKGLLLTVLNSQSVFCKFFVAVPVIWVSTVWECCLFSRLSINKEERPKTKIIPKKAFAWCYNVWFYKWGQLTPCYRGKSSFSCNSLNSVLALTNITINLCSMKNLNIMEN